MAQSFTAQSILSAATSIALSLPYPTGKQRWNGHRIYAAFSLLCNSEFVCFLDDDNWFEPDHLASLVAGIRADHAAWGFSLRRVFDADGNFVAPDNCESLGNLHPVFGNDSDRLIDTNCYLLRREVAVACDGLVSARRPDGGFGGRSGPLRIFC